MKNSKLKSWFGKKQVITSVLVLILAGAIYVNWRYSDLSTSGSGSTSSAVKTGRAEYVATNKVSVSNTYFDQARKERADSFDDAVSELEAIEKSSKASEEDKSKAYQSHIALVDRQEKQTAAESLILAKDFSDCVVVLGEDNVSVVVQAEELSDSEILQIQDVVVSVYPVELEKIKIIQIK